MYNYRDRFYKQYYRSQAGRSNFNAAISDKLKIDERHFRKEIIPLIDKPLDSTTLDIGCGYGSLVYTLQKTGFKNSSGIDLSEEQVKVAGELGIQNISMEDIKTHLKAQNKDARFYLVERHKHMPTKLRKNLENPD